MQRFRHIVLLLSTSPLAAMAQGSGAGGGMVVGGGVLALLLGLPLAGALFLMIALIGMREGKLAAKALAWGGFYCGVAVLGLFNGGSNTKLVVLLVMLALGPAVIFLILLVCTVMAYRRRG